MAEISLEARVKGYTAGLDPVRPEIFEEFLISTSVYHRDAIADRWDELTPSQRRSVERADANFIRHAARIAEWCEHDGLWCDREFHRIPIERWWWWADMTAAGTYPQQNLPAAARP
jgi:hypothetical protein